MPQSKKRTKKVKRETIPSSRSMNLFLGLWLIFGSIIVGGVLLYIGLVR